MPGREGLGTKPLAFTYNIYTYIIHIKIYTNTCNRHVVYIYVYMFVYMYMHHMYL